MRAQRGQRFAYVTGALLGALLGLRAGHAQGQPATTPYFEGDDGFNGGFQVRLSSAVYYASRDDFRQPLLLTGYFVRSMQALEVRSRFDLRLGLTPHLALQLAVPLVARRVDTELEGVLISQTAQLPMRALSLTGLGVGDPSVALAYRLLSLGGAHLYVDAGARIAIDDNTGGNTVPERMPPGAGQGWFLLGLGGTWRGGPWAVSLAYRFGYAPRASASYLVRRVSSQAYASGALAERLRHELQGRAAYHLSDALSLWLSPAASATDAARVMQGGAALEVVDEPTLWQLELRGGARFRLSGSHALELFYSQPVLDTWRTDPLFPLEMPAQGGGLMWIVNGS